VEWRGTGARRFAWLAGDPGAAREVAVRYGST
jgi:hypothetical protein